MCFNRSINRGGLSSFAASRAASIPAPGRGEQKSLEQRDILIPPSCPNSGRYRGEWGNNPDAPPSRGKCVRGLRLCGLNEAMLHREVAASSPSLFSPSPQSGFSSDSLPTTAGAHLSAPHFPPISAVIQSFPPPFPSLFSSLLPPFRGKFSLLYFLAASQGQIG